MSRHLFVLGFMSTGKSTIAPLLAERRGCPFIDLDARIADQAGNSISHIFQYEGEEGFRQRESAALESLADKPAGVIACGGGILTTEGNAERITNIGEAVVLTADASVIQQRSELDPARPMLTKWGEPPISIRVLLDRRASDYGQFPVSVDTSMMSPGEVADVVEERLAGRSGTSKIPVGSAEKPDYVVRIGHGILDDIGYAVAHVVNGRKAVIVTNPVVADLYLKTVQASMEKAGFETHVATMPDGEQYKTLETVGKLHDQVLNAGIDRQSVIIALGGGVVGDVAGFVAATALRGIAVVQVPTTMLAMVDSSIGGKTGVDHAVGKNLIGAFHQPKLVWADLATLESLPDKDYRNGLAEIVKYGMIADPFWPKTEWPTEVPVAGDATLLAYLEAHADAILNREAPVVASIVERCAAHKARVVAADEKEGGLRAILNYGHTVGHGLEAAAGYDGLMHGEGVALGMVAAARLAVETNRLSPEHAARQERLIERLGLPIHAPALSKADVLAAMRHDKKAVGNQLKFILARAIGSVEIVDDVPMDLVEQVVADLGCT